MKKLMATTLIVLAALASGGVAEAQPYTFDRTVATRQVPQNVVYQAQPQAVIRVDPGLVKTCVGQPGPFQSNPAIRQYILTSGGLRTPSTTFC